MPWGMMLARLAFMSRPYSDGLGLFVTRSKMPIRNRRMQNSPTGGAGLCASITTHKNGRPVHGERLSQAERAGSAAEGQRTVGGTCPGGQGKATPAAKLSQRNPERAPASIDLSPDTWLKVPSRAGPGARSDIRAATPAPSPPRPVRPEDAAGGSRP